MVRPAKIKFFVLKTKTFALNLFSRSSPCKEKGINLFSKPC